MRNSYRVLRRRYSVPVGLLVLLPLVLGACSFFASNSATPEPRPTLPLATLPPSIGPRDVAEFYPTEPASAQRGRQPYEKLCAECHGDTGRGDGPRAGQLGIDPTDFTNPDVRDKVPPSWYYHAITRGVVGTAMLGWETQLIEQQRWDVAFYTWSLASSAESIEQGRQLYAQECAACHGENGLGDAPRAEGLVQSPTPLADPRYLAGRSGEELLEAIAGGVTSLDHDWSNELTNPERRSIIDYVWTFLYNP